MLVVRALIIARVNEKGNTRAPPIYWLTELAGLASRKDYHRLYDLQIA